MTSQSGSIVKMADSAPVEESDTFGNYLIHGIDEIVLPDVIAWWPTAPGWQVLGALLIVGLGIVLYRATIKWWQNRYRREVLRRLSVLQHHSDSRLQDVVAMLPFYMKTTALHAFPRKDVASLSGDKWLAFLDAHYPGPSFVSGPGHKLLSIAYLPREQWVLNDSECEKLISMSRLWIARHSVVVNDRI